MSRQCTTHHRACDCREEQFQRLLEAAKEAVSLMDPINPRQDRTVDDLIKVIKECDK